MQFRTIIAAVGAQTNLMGIKGEDGLYRLPWNPGAFPEDMQYFVRQTKNGIVMMGPRTYGSIPKEKRPLKDRTTFVVSRTPGYEVPDGGVASPLVKVHGNIEEALRIADQWYPDAPIWCAGGPEFCAAFFPHAERVFLTRFDEETLPEILPGEKLYFPHYTERTWNKTIVESPMTAESGIRYWFEEWYRRIP